MKRLSIHKSLIPLLILCLAAAQGIYGQNPPAKAEAQYKAGAYEAAARSYERYLRNHQDPQASLYLARSYKALGKYELALPHYAKAIAPSGSSPEYKFELAKMLKTMGKYETAKTYFLQYAQASADTTLGMKWARSCDDARAIIADSLGYTITKAGIANTKYSEISPVWYKNGILFATNRPRGFLIRFFDKASRLPFYDLFFATFAPDGTLGKPTYQRDNLNTKFHDGPLSMPASEHVAYTTRTNVEGLGTSRDAAGFSRVNVYRIENHLDKWRKGTPVPFSSKDFNIAHPATNAEGTVLYFASDMPGGQGGTDLYVTRLSPKGWSAPQNLGPEVNTEANEGYPILTNDTTLYFASDRAEGLGGKDIFSTQYRAGQWTLVRNAGYPLNTPADDFGYCPSPIKPIGFFSSNRPGGQGDDDIWAFRRYRKLQTTFVDALTGLPVQGLQVELTDINQKKQTFTTGPDGTIGLTLRSSSDMMLQAKATDYQPLKEQLSFRNAPADQDIFRTITVQPIRRYNIAGLLTDANNAPLQGATIRLIGTTETTQTSDAAGHYEIPIEPGQAYTLIYQKPGYMPAIMDFASDADAEPQTYQFDLTLQQGASLLVEGKTSDPGAKSPLSDVNIRLLKTATQQDLSATTSRADGRFWIIIKEKGSHTLLASRGDYFSTRKTIERDTLTSDTMHLTLEMSPLQPGSVFKTLYYEYNKADIGNSAQADLQELVSLMKQNPGISVELSSHTDSRGSADFNKKLSQKRADQAAAFLLKAGIEKTRIKAIGYGEEKLANSCADGTNCTEAEHAQNRRSELRVIGVDAQKQSIQPTDTKSDLKAPQGKDLIKESTPPQGKDELKESAPPRNLGRGTTHVDNTGQGVIHRSDSITEDTPPTHQDSVPAAPRDTLPKRP